MKIALVHDHLISDGGGEQLLRVFTELWPEAPIFTLIHDARKTNPAFQGKDIHTSYLQHLPLGIRQFRWFLPLRPRAIEHIDLSGFDVVFSNTSALIKGVITSPKTLHINYCNTPTRFLWIDPTQRYDILERVWPVSFFSDWYKEHRLKQWDQDAAGRVDTFIANSQFAQQGICKYYSRDSQVIYPPVDTHLFDSREDLGDYFIIGGRLVPQKRYDIAIQAFNRLAMPLKVFGTGPELARLKRMAGPTIEFLGRVPDDQKKTLMARAQAFIYPQVEDFGITAVESMAAGRPVIAYRAGGALESIKDGETGILFDHQDWQSLAYAVLRFRKILFDSETIKQHAQQFSSERFRREIYAFVEHAWQKFQLQNHNPDPRGL